MAKIINEEKRAYPRVEANFDITLSKNCTGKSMNLSENGISFNTTEVISSPTLPLQINFPEEDFKFTTEARLVWKRDLETGFSLYGVEFINLNELSKEVLRKELIKTQISGLLNEIKTPEIKKLVSDFFLTDILTHISETIKIIRHVSKETHYSEETERKLDQLNTQILLKGFCLEELLPDKKIMQKVKEHFRHLLGTWIYKSAIMKRAFEKPRGYPGDYKMIEIVYDNKPISSNIGVYFDNYFLKSPYAVAVRMRKDRLRAMLQNFIEETKLSKIAILNIACGSCREIKELLPGLKTKSHVTFNCLDWDEEALKFSQDTLLPTAPKNVEFKFIKEDIMKMVKNESDIQSLAKQSLIYSIGLIDYLPDRILKKLIQVSYELLENNGKLILTHKNRDKTFPPVPPDWACDWKFVPRNKEEMVKLFYNCGISKFSFAVDSDDFGYIYYFTLTKK